MLLGLWLDQPYWVMFAVLVAPFALLALTLWLLTHVGLTRPLMLRVGGGVVPTYFTAISTLLALLTGFVANDAWERQRAAARVVQSERADARAIYELSLASVSDMKDIRAALTDYLDTVIAEEWPRMAEGDYSAEAGRKLGQLLAIIASPRITTEAGAPTHTALLSAAMALRAERGERLSLSTASGDGTKWLTLFVLAILTLVAIGIVHLDRPWAQATVMLLFSIAIVTTLGLIALHERPFDGPLALSADPLRIARQSMTITP